MPCAMAFGAPDALWQRISQVSVIKAPGNIPLTIFRDAALIFRYVRSKFAARITRRSDVQLIATMAFEQT